MLSNKLSKAEEEKLELESLSSSMESLYKKKHADLEDAIRAFQTKKPSPTKNNNYSNMAALRGKPTFLDFRSEDWMASMAEKVDDAREKIKDERENSHSENESSTATMAENWEPKMVAAAVTAEILKRDSSLASTVNKPIEMADIKVTGTLPPHDGEKCLQLPESIPPTPPPKTSSYPSIVEQQDASLPAKEEPEKHHESESEDDEQDDDNNDKDWVRGFQETADYRSVHGTHKIKSTSTGNTSKPLPTVAGTSADDSYEKYHKGAGSTQHEEASASVRFKRYQRDLVMASVDPSTARKCMMAEFFFYDHYFDLLSYLHHRKLRLEEFKMKHAELPKEDLLREWKLHTQTESAFLRKRRCRTQATHFHVLAQIGQGGYGQVFLVRKKDTNEICALKKMSKQQLHKMNEVQHILTERDVLTQTKSPWLVKLLYAFQDFKHVYLAMEFVPGGDVRTLLNNSGILREADARFYAAEMFMSVSELHRLGYIHRDLKPENFLIDTAGHIKLTDFGLSKGQLSDARVESLRVKLDEVKYASITRYSSMQKRSLHRVWRQEDLTKAYSLVGSPDYMAPEILTHSNHAARTGVYTGGYDYLVDYWSLGCIVFEFLCGYPPFAGPTMEEVWVNVYHWQEILERPSYEGADAEFNLSNTAWDFITKLITHRHSRLDSLDKVQAHPWFEEWNARLMEGLQNGGGETAPRPLWEALRWTSSANGGLVDPPFIPELTNDLDTSHFDDFSNPDGLEMYKDVYEKQRKLESQMEADSSAAAAASSSSSSPGGKGKEQHGARQAFVGFTFRHKNALEQVPSRLPEETTPSRSDGMMGRLRFKHNK